MKYKKLDIDFAIPEILKSSINAFLDDLNEHNGNLADCYEQDIRNTLNGCDMCLEPEQIALLRDYYVKGGIYRSKLSCQYS